MINIIKKSLNNSIERSVQSVGLGEHQLPVSRGLVLKSENGLIMKRTEIGSIAGNVGYFATDIVVIGGLGTVPPKIDSLEYNYDHFEASSDGSWRQRRTRPIQGRPEDLTVGELWDISLALRHVRKAQAKS